MGRFGLFVLALAAATGCREAAQCRSDVARAQEIVTAVDSKSIDSLKNAEAALDSAIGACDKAGLGAERSKLVDAKHQITAHRELVERKAARKKRAAPTAEELARLEKEGDPTCPKGQAYKPGGSGKEIRCSGPQLVDMSMADVKDYFETRRFTVKTEKEPPRLRAELGSEVYVFRYDKPDSTEGATCLELYPPPGARWQEAVARATGISLDKVKVGKTVKAKRGELPIAADDSEKQTAKIGSCG